MFGGGGLLFTVIGVITLKVAPAAGSFEPAPRPFENDERTGPSRPCQACGQALPAGHKLCSNCGLLGREAQSNWHEQRVKRVQAPCMLYPFAFFLLRKTGSNDAPWANSAITDKIRKTRDKRMFSEFWTGSSPDSSIFRVLSDGHAKLASNLFPFNAPTIYPPIAHLFIDLSLVLSSASAKVGAEHRAA